MEKFSQQMNNSVRTELSSCASSEKINRLERSFWHSEQEVFQVDDRSYKVCVTIYVLSPFISR